MNFPAVLIPAYGAIFLASIYFCGYAYLDGYYEFFNISISELGFGFEDYLAHSAPTFLAAFREFWAWLDARTFHIFFVFMLLAVFIFCLWRLMVRSQLSVSAQIDSIGHVAIYASSALILVLCGGVALTAHEFGKEVAAKELVSLKPVQVYVSGELSAMLGQDLEGLPRGIQRHLLSTEKMHYLVYEMDGGERRWLIRIPASEVQLLGAKLQ